MSKPDKPGELRDVTVNAISLVSKAANGERFKIFKSAEPEGKETAKSVEPEEKKAPETVKKDERGLFRILKEFFTGTDVAVEKGEVADVYNSRDASRKICEAFEALMKVLGLSSWDDSIIPETDSAKILSALDDFRNIAIDILLGKNGIEKIEKSGRKISAPRLSRLKNAQAILNEVLRELEDNNDMPKETEDVTKEEIQKMVENAVKAVNEGQKTSEEQKSVEAPEKMVSIEDVVKNALTPIIERIEKIENARGVSNRVPEDSAVEKSANDFWGGIF